MFSVTILFMEESLCWIPTVKPGRNLAEAEIVYAHA